MTYMEAYKRMDSLCKKKMKSKAVGNEKRSGVTLYLMEMDECTVAKFRDAKWNEDYRSLKSYRHKRNQIAHDVGVSEKKLCRAKDIKWVKNFCRRLEKGNDPISLYKKAEKRGGPSLGKRIWNAIGRLFHS